MSPASTAALPSITSQSRPGAIERLIRETGREPQERDTLYRRVERDGEKWQSGAAIGVAP